MKRLIKKANFDPMEWLQAPNDQKTPLSELSEDEIKAIEDLTGTKIERPGTGYEFDKNGNGLEPMNSKVKVKWISSGKLYRAIDGNEFRKIQDTGYIKSNSSKNFDWQGNVTFFDKEFNNVVGYANDCFRKTGEGFVIEISNIDDIELYMNSVYEIYSYDKISSSHITKVWQLQKNGRFEEVEF